MEEQGNKSFPAASTFLVSADLISPEQSTDIQSIQSHILGLRELALFEEQSGCFGKAEVLWKQATGLAERYLPASQLLARVAIDTGSFLFRFLPKSQIPLKYLRAGLSLSQYLDPEETTNATLTVARCLIGWNDFGEAEKVLRQLDRSNPEIEVKVLCCFGMIEQEEHDLLTSESNFREAIEKARTLQPGLYAECVVHLCEVLLEKEQYCECQSLLLQVVLSLLSHHRPLLPLALRTLMKALEETNQFALLDSTLESVIRELNAANESPYLIATILTEWGDAYSQVSPEFAALHYFQAIRLYESVQRSTWYIAGVLQKLVHLQVTFEEIRFSYIYSSVPPSWLDHVKTQSLQMLTVISYELPVAATGLSLCIPAITRLTHYSASQMTWLQVRLEPLLTSHDDIERGEALLCLTRVESESRLEPLTSAFIASHPASLLSARLLATLRGKSSEVVEMMRRVDASELEIDGYLRHLSPFLSSISPGKDYEANLTDAPSSFMSVDALVSRSDLCLQYGRKEEDLEAWQRALRMAESINLFSSRYFSVLFKFFQVEYSEATFLQVLRANSQRPVSSKMLEAVYITLNSAEDTQNTGQMTKHLQVVRELDAMACRVPMHLALFDRVKSSFYGLFTSFLKRVLVGCADSVREAAAHYQLLKAELDWFYGERRRFLLFGDCPQLCIVMKLLKSEELEINFCSQECLALRGYAMTRGVEYNDGLDRQQNLAFLRSLYQVAK